VTVEDLVPHVAAPVKNNPAVVCVRICLAV
jgi:hypothetical protein